MPIQTFLRRGVTPDAGAAAPATGDAPVPGFAGENVSTATGSNESSNTATLPIDTTSRLRSGRGLLVTLLRPTRVPLGLWLASTHCPSCTRNSPWRRET